MLSGGERPTAPAVLLARPLLGIDLTPRSGTRASSSASGRRKRSTTPSCSERGRRRSRRLTSIRTWPTRSRSRCPTARPREYRRASTGAESPLDRARAGQGGGRGRGRRRRADGPTVDWLDLDRPIERDAASRSSPPTRPTGREVLRHSTAHVMAQAVTDLFPGAKYAIGPAIEDGFYYDFELPDGAHFTDDDLERIEARMREIVKADQPFVREEVDRDDGARACSPTSPTSARSSSGSTPPPRCGRGHGRSPCYRNPRPDGVEFVDLCRGPHVPSTKRLGAFKLTKVAGAYWRGDEQRPDAPAHLRHGVGVEGRAGGVPPPPRGGRAARPPQARRRARPVLVPRGDRLRARGVPPEGRAGPQAHGGLLAPAPRGGGLLSS